MSANHVPHRLRRLIRLALREGWQVDVGTDLRLTLRKPGFASIHTGAHSNDGRPPIHRRRSQSGEAHD
ncbi:hypothetical protein SAMN04490182_2012 [Pseudomonas cedrina]|uniref:Cobyrinic acid a,c-diamide synthase n=1 Tax=Pseudomonas cedrina TaxID=651740 RepID=A0ABY0UGY3_PSECE|nr:hypothetical protein [Pseudomonas cedrina]SDS63628.1 hypothetical protein SAMN04490182_2012 [Pseudomonas cedrina]